MQANIYAGQRRRELPSELSALKAEDYVRQLLSTSGSGMATSLYSRPR